MGHVPGGKRGYATARLIFDLAETAPYRPYVHGRLTLAGLDPSRVSAASWLDAVYAILMEAPAEALQKMHDQLVIKAAILRPDRATWGLAPEQIALSNRLTGKGT